MLTTGAGSHVRWNLPWLHLNSFTGLAETDRTRYLTLLGLDHAIYIYPDRVLRQFGRQQNVPALEATKGPSFEVSHSKCQKWIHTWHRRTIWYIPEPRASTWVSPSYLKWTKEPLLEVRKRLRKDDQVDWKKHMKAMENREFFTGPTLHRPEPETETDTTPRAEPTAPNVWKRLGTREASGPSLAERLGPRPSAKERLGPREESEIPPKKRARMMMGETSSRSGGSRPS